MVYLCIHATELLNPPPKKKNLTQINCNTQYNHRKAKSNQQTTVTSVHLCVCALHCAHMLHTKRPTAQNRSDKSQIPLRYLVADRFEAGSN